MWNNKRVQKERKAGKDRPSWSNKTGVSFVGEREKNSRLERRAKNRIADWYLACPRG